MRRRRVVEDTELKPNMTPMIDVVFQLIIFFMVVTDLTQRELEDLQSPKAEHAQKYEKGVEDRMIVNVLRNGDIRIERKLYSIEALTFRLKAYADILPKDKDGLPDGVVFMRADKEAPFKYIQKVMEVCGNEQIKIWKVNIVAEQPTGATEASPR